MNIDKDRVGDNNAPIIRATAIFDKNSDNCAVCFSLRTICIF